MNNKRANANGISQAPSDANVAQISADSIKGELLQLISLQSQQIGLMQQLVQANNAKGISAPVPSAEQASFNQIPQNVNFQPSTIQGSFASNQQQFNGYMSSLSGKNNNYGFIDGLFPANSRMSATSQALTSMDFGSRVGQAGIAGVGAIGSTALTFGLPTVIPGMAGIGASMLGGATIGLTADAAIKEMKKQNSYEKYIFKNSNKFISPDESNNKRGLGGFSVGESKDAAGFLRTINDDMFMKDEEMMSLVQKYTEGGLLKDTKDLQGFKDKVQSLSKTVKTGAIMLNDTYDNIADLMSELRKMGVDQRNYEEIMGLGNLAGLSSGVNGTQNLNNTSQIVQNLNYGTGVNNESTMTRFFDTQLYMGKLDEQLSLKPNKTESEQIIYNMIKNFGGVDKAAQELQVSFEKIISNNQMLKDPALAFFDWNGSDNSFKFNNESYKAYLNNEKSISELNQEGIKKLEGNNAAIEQWNTNGSTYIKNSLKDGDLTKYMDTTIEAYTRDVAYAGLDERAVLGLLGVKDNNMQNFMSGFMNYREHLGDDYGNKARQQVAWQTAMSEKKSQMPSLTESLSAMWEKGKDFITQPFVTMGNNINDMVLKASDKWYGYDENKMTRYDEFFSTSSDMRSMSGENVKDGLNQANELIASSMNSLKDLTAKGFEINKELMGTVKDRYDNTDKVVKYDRAVIANWDELDESVKKDKDKITGLAKETDLSETIVAALLKFNQRHPDNDKVTKGDVDGFVRALGSNNFDYGGNTELAIAATVAGKDNVDRQLQGMGYDVSGLRSVGAQEILREVGLGDLELDKDISEAIKEVLKENLGGNITISNTDPNATTEGATGNFQGANQEQIKNMDLRTKSNVTADDLNAIIEKNAKSGSLMLGTGDAFMKAGQETGLDPLYLLAHSAQETGWGKPNGISAKKNNFFGIGAFNSSPLASAYTYADKEAGIIEGAKWISDKYINSEKYNQNTLEKMIGVEGHRYALYDDGSPNTGWVNGISNIMAKGLEYVGKGYDADGSLGATGSGTTTTTTTTKVDPRIAYETVYKDETGKNIDPAKLKKQEEENKIREGFGSTKNDKNISGLANFAKGSSELGTSDEDITEKQSEIRKKIKKSGGFINQGFYGRELNEYSNLLEDAMGSGKYMTVEEALESDKKLKLKRQQVVKMTGSVGGGLSNKDQKLLEELEGLESLKYNNDYINKDAQVLRNFGEASGIKASHYGSRSDYNRALNDNASAFYENNLAAMTDFMAGKSTESAQSWAKMSATEKAATYKAMQELESSIGVEKEDGIKTKVTTAGNKGDETNAKGRKGDETDIFTSEEKNKLNYLHYEKDSKGEKTGKIVYDSEKKSNEGMGVDQLLEWREQGEKSVDYTLRDASKKYLGVNKEGKSIQELETLAKREYQKIDDDMLTAEGDLNKILKSIDKGGSPLGNIDKKVADLIMSKDKDGLEAMKKQYTGKAEEGNKGAIANVTAIDQVMQLMDKIDGTNADGIMAILSGLEQIETIAKDLGNTIEYTKAQMADSKVYTTAVNESIANSGKSLFSGDSKEDKDITAYLEKYAKTPEETAKMLTDALINGGILENDKDDKTVTLSADALSALSEAVAQASSQALAETFKDPSNQGVDKALGDKGTRDELEKITIQFGDNAGKTGAEVAEELKKTNEQIKKDGAAASKEAIETRDQLVKDLVPAYEEAVKAIGDGVGKGGEDLKTTAETFATQIAAYDKSIASAIKTLSNRVNSADSWGVNTNSGGYRPPNPGLLGRPD